MDLQEKQNQKQSVSEVIAGMPHALSPYHMSIATRLAVLLCVPDERVLHVVHAAGAAVNNVQMEHPDVCVIRAAWSTGLLYAEEDVSNLWWFAPLERHARVVTALRVVDRVPYETLAAVWRGRTQEECARIVAESCATMYRASDEAVQVQQSDLMQVFRAADAQISAEQFVQMRSDVPENIDTVWDFYDHIRARASHMGAHAVHHYLKTVSDEMALQMTQMQQTHSMPAPAPVAPKVIDRPDAHDVAQAQASKTQKKSQRRGRGIFGKKRATKESSERPALRTSVLRQVLTMAGLLSVTMTILVGLLIGLSHVEVAPPTLPEDAQATEHGTVQGAQTVAAQERTVADVLTEISTQVAAAKSDVYPHLFDDVLFAQAAQDSVRVTQRLQ